MRILSFDQATAKTGFAVFDNDKLIESGVIKAKADTSTDKLNEMFSLVVLKIESTNPDIVVIEGVVLQKSPYVLIMLAQLQGMIVGYCHKKGVLIEIFGATTWRKNLNFNQGIKVARKELKRQAKEYASRLTDKKVTEDEADAICIGSSYVKSRILGGN